MTNFVASVVYSLVTVILSQRTHALARTYAQSDVYEHQFVTIITSAPGGEGRDVAKHRICAVRIEVFSL
jgi:hypothetical protein